MKIRCEVCGIEGYLQHLSENYYRVRHYVGSEGGKLRFAYHKQSIQYMQSYLNGNESRSVDPIDLKAIDLKKHSSGSFLKNMAGVVGFEPTTPNLGGWCSVRTDPLMPDSTLDKRESVVRTELHAQEIPNIQSVLLYLEGKEEAKANYEIAIQICKSDSNWDKKRLPNAPYIGEIIGNIDRELCDLMSQSAR